MPKNIDVSSGPTLNLPGTREPNVEDAAMPQNVAITDPAGTTLRA